MIPPEDDPEAIELAEIDLGELCRLAVTVAHEAAELVRRQRREGVEVAGTKSSEVDVVTRTDRASEELIRERLLTARPGDGFLGEEDGEQEGDSGVTWVVDPIDGTVNFLYGIPQYAVSIAARVGGRTVVGVVVDVAHATTYRAVDGLGAWRDDVPLQVRDTVPMAQRLVLTGFNYERHIREVQAAAIGRLLPQVRDLRRQGSCALDLCHVAEGSGDAYVEEGVALWDHAAGELVAREAGATVLLTTGRGGKPCILAAPAAGFAEFEAVITECGFLSASS